MKAVLALLALVAVARAQQNICNAKADIVFIVDGSGSIGPPNFALVLGFMQDVVKEFKVGPDDVQFGMIKYTDSKREREFYLNTYSKKQDILNKLNKILYYGGGTFTGAAIKEAADQMFTKPRGLRQDQGVPSIAIVITDGRSYDDVTRPSYDLKAKYVQTFAVGIGNQVRQAELNAISSDPDKDFVFNVNGFAGLQKIKDLLSTKACALETLPTTLTPPPTPPTLAPVTNPPVTNPPVTKPPITQKPPFGTRTPPPTAGPSRSPPFGTQTPLPTAGPTRFPPTTKEGTFRPIVTNRPVVPTNGPVLPTNAPVKVQCSSDQSDIVFALDSSGSIGIDNWRVLKTFVKNLIASFDVSPNKVRVGALRFSDDVTNQFHLKDAKTAKIALDGLDLMQYDQGGTKTHLAIKYMRENSFSPQNGARNYKVPKIAIVITDGNSADVIKTKDEAAALKAQGVTVFAIGVGSLIKRTELDNMASSSNHVFQVQDFKGLNTIQASLGQLACVNIQTPVTGTPKPATQAPGQTCCEDKVSDCDLYDTDLCTDFAPWASQNCAVRCGLCPAGVPLCSTTPPSRPCVDALRDCASYGTDICTNKGYTEWSKTNCYKFCGHCTGGPTAAPVTQKPGTEAPRVCENKLSDCPSYGKELCTNSYKDWAKENCYQFCGYCTGGATQAPGPCIDGLSDCASYGADICKTPGYEAWIKTNCAKFCNTC